MPLSYRDIDGNVRTIGRKLDCIGTPTLKVVIELFHKPATKTNNSFRAITMAMYGHRAPRLYSIEHPLRLIIR